MLRRLFTYFEFVVGPAKLEKTVDEIREPAEPLIRTKVIITYLTNYRLRRNLLCSNVSYFQYKTFDGTVVGWG